MMLSGIATTTWGDVVIHENADPRRHVSETGLCDTGCSPVSVLDITQASDEQPEPIEFYSPTLHYIHFYRSNYHFAFTHRYTFSQGPNSSFASVTEVVQIPGHETEAVPIPTVVTEGDIIDGNMSYGGCTFMLAESYQLGYYAMPIEEGETKIIPVRIILDDGVHFGFVELASTGQLDIGGSGYPRLRPIRWGYETAPDVPFVFPAEQCGIADFEPDGELNFFDVSAFLSAFTAMDAAADLNDDGDWNFFDVSDFLSAFSAGCP